MPFEEFHDKKVAEGLLFSYYEKKKMIMVR